MIVLLLLLLGAAIALLAWLFASHPRVEMITAGASLGCLLGAGVWQLYVNHEVDDHALAVSLALAAGLLALVGGGPATAVVLRWVDREEAAAGGEHPRPTLEAAAERLRGGAWIGAFERVAVSASLLLGWPEGIAVALAIKALGRYPELKSPADAAAERFIIGTFTSVLWAAGCAGVAVLTLSSTG
jgi:hypothetical protein